MAAGSTVYKATIDISDLDRSYYAQHVLTLACHPSETEERLMLRVLMFAMHAGEKVEFGRGLSTDGEPALWQMDDTGHIETWMDVGLPAIKQVRRAAGRSDKVVILAYDEEKFAPWWQSNQSELLKIEKLEIWMVSNHSAQELAKMAVRNMKLGVTIQDGVLWICNDQINIQMELNVIKHLSFRY